MSLSYESTSQNFRSSPYVLPVDLGLMSKVLTYEDQQFTQNANKEQQQIDSLASMDVAKPQDKQYLNSKVNSLVNGINNLGGVNLGDPSVLNQIQGMGADIYSDQKILNAVSGTKAFRNMQQEYNTWLTNPKFKGYYSKANESYSLNQASQWFNDGQVGSNYNGPTSATPYFDNDKLARDTFSKLKNDNYTESTFQKGMYINKQTNEVKSEREIAQQARDLVLQNPQAAEQAKINSWYLTAGMGLGGNEVIKGLIQTTDNDLADVQSEIDSNKKGRDASANDPNAYNVYNTNLNRLTTYQKQLNDKKQHLATNGIDEYEKNPTGYQMDYYLNNWTRGIGRLYQVNKSTNELKADPAAMLQATITQRDRHDEMEAAFHGLRKVPDPSNPNGYSWLRDYSLLSIKGGKPLKGPVDDYGNPIGSDGVLEPNVDVTANPEAAYRVDLDTTKNHINDIETQKQSVLVDYLSQLSKTDPQLAFLSGDKRKAVLDQLTRLGQHIENSQNPFNVNYLNYAQGLVASKTLTPDQANFLQNIYKMYHAKSMGQTVDVSKLPDGFQDTFNTIQELNNEADFEKRRISGYNQILNGSLSSQEQTLLSDYQLHPEKYTTTRVQGTGPGGYGQVTTVKPEVQNILNKIENLPSNTKNDYWKQFSVRPQYYLKYYGDDDQKYLGDAISDVVIHQSKSHPELAGIPSEYIKIRGVGRRNDGQDGYAEYVEVTNKDKNGVHANIMMLPISSQTAAMKYGILPLPKDTENVAKEVAFDGRSQPRIVSNPNGISARVFVVRVPGPTPSYQARITTLSGMKVNISRPTSDAESAYESAKGLILTYQGKDYNTFIQQAINSQEINNGR